MVKAIMHGCNGKMGQVISGLVKEDDVIEIVAGIDKFTGIENPYPVFTSLAECDVQADVVIDFSNAAAVDELLDVCVEKTLPVVLCTTGLSEEQLAKVKEAGEKVAVLRSANMSLGVNLLMKLLKDAAKVLAPAGFDIEIVEKHHNQKIDVQVEQRSHLQIRLMKRWLTSMYTIMTAAMNEKNVRKTKSGSLQYVEVRSLDSMTSSLRGQMK